MSKFLFQTAFETPGGRTARPQPPAISPERLDEARAEGFAAGHADARQASEALAADALRGIADGFASLQAAHAAALHRIEIDSCRLAHAVASKLAASLMRAHPLAEIETMMAQVLRERFDEPRVVLRAAEPVVEALKERVAALAAEAGYQGSVVLLTDERLSGADCRLEWADGGAARDHKQLAATIDGIVERHLQLMLS